ncbi:MAG TPA: glycosyltransferase family 39 protein, partial [Clostridia bacterium]
YQVALYYVTALSFRIFGISEWAGRLPSILCWVALIFSGMYISRKLFKGKSWIITGLFLSFSQIQLAWATQLRPYIWLELFTLWIVYLSYLSTKSKLIDRNLLLASLLSLLSILFHGTGLLNLVIIANVFVYKIIKSQKFEYLFVIPVIGILGIVVIFNSFQGGWDFVQKTLFHFYFSPLHYRIFLTHGYWWLILGSTIGVYLLYKKDKILSFLFSGSIAFIFFMAIFKINPNYVRYSLTAFPLMYVLFPYGLIEGLSKIIKNKYLYWSLIALVFIYLTYIGKIVIIPKAYYSINADMRENPIVDYKNTFQKIKELLKDKQNSLVIDAWNDRVPWYMPNQKFIMANYATPTGIDPIYGEEYVGTVSGIKQKISEHSSGIAIVEDWQSFMSGDVKEYIRKNLKYEFTEQDLPGNENDHWGISVYSWGI